MSYFVSPAIKSALLTDPSVLHNVDINVILFRTAPSMSSDASSLWRNANTKAELLTYLGWEEVLGIPGYPLTTKLRLNQRPHPAWTSGDPTIFLNNYFYTFDEFLFDDLGQAISIAAIGFELVSDGSLVLVTNTPTGTLTNLTPGDKLIAAENLDFPDDTNRYLLSYAKNPVAVDPVEGPLILLKAAPVFEISNTLHVWCYPQRANMIANPSFEAPEADDYWSPAVERVNDPAPGGGAWAGKFTGTAPFAVESNVWPTIYGNDQSELWTVQLMAKCGEGVGQCTVRVGLVFWDADYRGTNVDWGEEVWNLRGDAWIDIKAVRNTPQAHQAMLRIEVYGGDITIDRVLCERGALKDWPYFDGDSTYAASGAYSWYGGEALAGKSYSMWYSGRRAVVGRLFATPKDTDAPEDYITDTDVLAAGMVYKWVPAGVTVIPHMDVFYPNDLRWWPPPRTKPVLPHSEPGDDGMGVEDPWRPEDLPKGVWAQTSDATIGVFAVSGSFVHGTRPTVTINKGAGQDDPSHDSVAVVFDVVFSEAVVNFTAADVIVGGTATWTGSPTVVVTGSGATYTVTVSGMITDGTVTASIPDSAADSLTSDKTQASTSTDNNVSWFDPLKQTGWWGIGHSGRQQYTKTLAGTGRVKLAGAAGYGNVAGGALDVEMTLRDYVISIGESPSATPNGITAATEMDETWGYGGRGGLYAIYGGPTGWTRRHGGGRTELRTASNRSSAVLIAPGGGGSGGPGGFPQGLPVTASGNTGQFSGMSGTGGTQTAAGNAGLGYHQSVPGAGCGGESGDTGSGLGAGGRGGNGIVDFASGDGGGGGGGGKHGGGGGAGGDGAGAQTGGGGSGDVSLAAATYNTYTGVCQGLGLAAMQVKQSYTDRVRQFLLSDTPRTYVSAEEAIETGSIVVADLVSGKPFFDRLAATIFDGTAASPTQLFQGHTMAGRGAMHCSLVGSQNSPDFQMPAVDAASGFFWNPPTFNAGVGWAIEWTQQTISGNADGPGCSSVTTPGNYGNATANQMPWKVSASPTSISLTVATTALNVTATATATLASKPTTQFTRYGISYNAGTDTFHFYRSAGYGEASVTATQTRAAAGIPTSGQWNLQTWRPLMFSSITANAESRIQDVALFDVHRTQAQFFNSFQALSGSNYGAQTWAGSTATVGVAGTSGTPLWAIYIPQTWAGSTAAVGVSAVSGSMGLVYEYADGAFHDVIVPDGSVSAVLEVWGAGQGSTANLNGFGAYAKGTISGLVAGETLRLTPGGIGVGAGPGGFNGGGACTALGGSDGNGGNGASDVRRGGFALANRVIVGGAGGGGINASGGGKGGDGGYPTGGVGTAASGNGGGGTQTAGGASVAGPPNGTLGVGATSPSGPGGGRGGGGGGGGYWGGGSGASGFGTSCSGGGGSSYVDPALTAVTTEAVGTWSGAGKVKVTFILSQPPAPLLFWGSNTGSGGLTATPPASMTLSVPTFMIVGQNARDIDPAIAAPPGFSGAATLSPNSVVAAPTFYDTGGVSTGSAGIWSRTVTGAGTVTSAQGGFPIDWVLRSSDWKGIVQSARSTVANTGVVSLSLPNAPGPANNRLVLAIVQYAMDGNLPATTATPSGWTSLYHFGRNGSTYSEYVWILRSNQQSIAFDLSTGQGRDVVLLELSTSPFDPVTLIPWGHLLYVDGPEMLATVSNGAGGTGGGGYTNNDRVLGWPDEIGTQDASLPFGTGPRYQQFDTDLNFQKTLKFGNGDLLRTSAVTLVNPPFSVVIIGRKTGNADGFYTDGRTSSPRVTSGGTSGASGPNQAYNGTALTGGTATTNAELWVGYYHPTSGAIEVNGTVVATGPTGSQGYDGFMIGTSFNDALVGQRMLGSAALVGFYPGDVRTHANWSAFKAGTAVKYGITIA